MLTSTCDAHGSGGVVDLVARCGGLTTCSRVGGGGKGGGGSGRGSSMVAMICLRVCGGWAAPRCATQQLSPTPRGQGARARWLELGPGTVAYCSSPVCDMSLYVGGLLLVSCASVCLHLLPIMSFRHPSLTCIKV
jgi:hypothetical protein